MDPLGHGLRGLLRLFTGRRLPRTAGGLAVSGPAGPVRILRNAYGVPWIQAESEPDAWFGLGFCQAQDRAFQLEGLRRLFHGRLAELVGEAGLPADRLSRRIGFARAAAEQLELVDAATRGVLESFVAGINQGLRHGGAGRPHELLLLRSRSGGWSPSDPLAMLKLMSFLIPTNWDMELVRLRILTLDGPAALRDLEPEHPDWLPATLPPGQRAGRALDRLAGELERYLTLAGGPGGGSNNWALAGHRTASGRPILANDTHLEPALPCPWYLAALRWPEGGIAGAAMTGTPAFGAGHNGHVAWGITVGYVDNTDLFLEEVGDDGASVRHGDGYVRCEVRREVIRVRGRPPVEEAVLVTPRGPVIGPALDGEHGAISMRATWLEPRPMAALLGLSRARSAMDLRAALGDMPIISLNLVFADADGRIGWQLAGTAPHRTHGHGLIPLPGAGVGDGWEAEPVPFEAMPGAIDPPGGFVATSNNKPLGDDGDRPFLGADWLDGYRLARVVELLAGRDTGWTPADMARLQLDRFTRPWPELRDRILALPVADPDARTAIHLLADWDGRMEPDSPAASVFALFLGNLAGRVVTARAPNARDWALGRGFSTLTPTGTIAVRRTGQLVRLLRDRPAGWFDDGWDAQAAAALADAVRTLRRRHGREPRRWAWGRVRPLTLRHAFGDRPLLGRIFNRGPYPVGGDASTVAQAASGPDPTSNPVFVPVMRMIVEPPAWDEARFVLAGGQSGNPMSPHYDDQIPLWREGASIRLPWTGEAAAADAAATLVLRPAAGG